MGRAWLSAPEQPCLRPACSPRFPPHPQQPLLGQFSVSGNNQLLNLGCSKLEELRLVKPNAAGLVVATDIEHAQQIALALDARGEGCRIVTNKTPDAQQVNNAFSESNCRWIVAVGMISEGTDIPRLQVCCYLSRIRTELHYRQVQGCGFHGDPATHSMNIRPLIPR